MTFFSVAYFLASEAFTLAAAAALIVSIVGSNGSAGAVIGAADADGALTVPAVGICSGKGAVDGKGAFTTIGAVSTWSITIAGISLVSCSMVADGLGEFSLVVELIVVIVAVATPVVFEFVLVTLTMTLVCP